MLTHNSYLRAGFERVNFHQKLSLFQYCKSQNTGQICASPSKRKTKTKQSKYQHASCAGFEKIQKKKN